MILPALASNQRLVTIADRTALRGRRAAARAAAGHRSRRGLLLSRLRPVWPVWRQGDHGDAERGALRPRRPPPSCPPDRPEDCRALHRHRGRDRYMDSQAWCARPPPIDKFVPVSRFGWGLFLRPGLHNVGAPRAAAVKDGRRPSRSGARRASLTGASTALRLIAPGPRSSASNRATPEPAGHGSYPLTDLAPCPRAAVRSTLCW